MRYTNTIKKPLRYGTIRGELCSMERCIVIQHIHPPCVRSCGTIKKKFMTKLDPDFVGPNTRFMRKLFCKDFVNYLLVPLQMAGGLDQELTKLVAEFEILRPNKPSIWDDEERKAALAITGRARNGQLA